MMKIISMIVCCFLIFACSEDQKESQKDQVSDQMQSMINTDQKIDQTIQIDQSTTVDQMIADMAVSAEKCTMPMDHPCDGQADGPSVLNEHSAVYDDQRMEMLIFGGNTAVPENCGFPSYTAETTVWIYYDYPLPDTCGHWLKVDAGENGPAGRARHSAVFANGKMWVFGGRFKKSSGYGLFNDLWAFDVATRTWQAFNPPSAPSARVNSSMVYDSKRNLIWVFGGNSSTSGLNINALNDLWQYDIAQNTWTEVRYTDQSDGFASVPRLWHAGLYDEKRDRLVYFGGGDSGSLNVASYFYDLAIYDITNNTWESITPLNRPDGRFWSQMVYQKQSDHYLLFGGHDDQALGNRNDTWRFDPNQGLWEMMGNADTFLREANGACDFPYDFATTDKNIPERRNAHTLVWSNQCERAILFGGKTDCGAINDLWYWQDQAWVKQVNASEGESCGRWRSNPENCANLCF